MLVKEMHKETMHCGYIGGAESHSTPDYSRQRDCSGDLYAPTTYAPTNYSSSPLQDRHFHTKYEDDNNNQFSYSENISSKNYDAVLDNSVSSVLSGLQLSECPPLLTANADYPPAKASKPGNRAKKTSKSKLNKNANSDKSRNRKDSFVYDVRLPDEQQYLFFVPDLDLVKSHLMFAVREEVEVLKERIVELMDKITNLECENTLLRQYASPDALHQVKQTQSQGGVQPPLPHHTSS